MKKLFLLFLGIILLQTCAFAKDDIDIKYNDGIYHITLSGDKIIKKIKVYATSGLRTNAEIHKESGAKLTVNAGYFDPQNEKTISYVTMDGHIYEDPMLNENLLANSFLRKNLNKIMNLSSFTIYATLYWFKLYISKIFVTKDSKTQEFKHAYNEKYSLLTKHGVSLKICTR